jgi:hypothetical protein
MTGGVRIPFFSQSGSSRDAAGDLHFLGYFLGGHHNIL